MYYLATKFELTSIADGIRKITGESNKISYPFIEAIDNIQTLNLDNYDTLIGFKDENNYTGEIGSLPQNTYVTFLSNPYTDIATISTFSFFIEPSSESNSSTYNPYKTNFALKGINFKQAKTILEYDISGFYKPNLQGIEEAVLPQCEAIGHEGLFRGSYTYIDLPKVKEIGMYGLGGNTDLLSISLPECEEIRSYGMAGCRKISQIFLPKCVSLSEGAFANCSNLQSISLPVCKTILRTTFYSCNNLSFISLPMLEKVPLEGFVYMLNLHEVYLEKCSKIDEWGFYDPDYPSRQTDQLSIYLNTSSMVNLVNINAFPDNTTIYVPESLYSAYVSDTNWRFISSQIISTKNF